MGGADIVELHVSQLLQRVLYGCAVFTHDIRVVALHLQPVGVAVDLCVDDATIQGTKATKGVATEERGATQRDHRLWPVYHWCQHEAKRLLAKSNGIAILHLYGTLCDAIESFHHLESLLVANYLYLWIVFLDEGNRTAVVGLHVVDNQVVHLAVANDLVDVFNKLCEEVHLDSIDETHFLVVDEIRVIAHTIRQWPQTFKQRLVTIVDTNVVNVFSNFLHSMNVF